MLSSPVLLEEEAGREECHRRYFQNTKGNKFTIIGVVDDPDTKTSWMPDIFMSDELDEFLFFDPIYAMLMAPDTDIALLNKSIQKNTPAANGALMRQYAISICL